MLPFHHHHQACSFRLGPLSLVDVIGTAAPLQVTLELGAWGGWCERNGQAGGRGRQAGRQAGMQAVGRAGGRAGRQPGRQRCWSPHTHARTQCCWSPHACVPTCLHLSLVPLCFSAQLTNHGMSPPCQCPVPYHSEPQSPSLGHLDAPGSFILAQKVLTVLYSVV